MAKIKDVRGDYETKSVFRASIVGACTLGTIFFFLGWLAFYVFVDVNVIMLLLAWVFVFLLATFSSSFFGHKYYKRLRKKWLTGWEFVDLCFLFDLADLKRLNDHIRIENLSKQKIRIIKSSHGTMFVYKETINIPKQ